MANGPVLSKYYSNGNFIYPSDDSCWVLAETGDGCGISYEYLKGLGGPYYKCIMYMYIEETKLVYYKKGDVSWGIPLVITGVQDKLDEENILVFPNPAHDNLTIRIKDFNRTEVFEILDITGRIIVKTNIVSEESKVKIEDLKPGTYVYRLRNDTEILKMDKLIIN
jgi:hypothetical protein